MKAEQVEMNFIVTIFFLKSFIQFSFLIYARSNQAQNLLVVFR